MKSGVPWEIFMNRTEPPTDWIWTQTMVNFSAQAAVAKKPVFLGVLLGRNSLAPNAEFVSPSQMKFNDSFSGSCPDLSTGLGLQLRTAYVRYVQWMVQNFRPKYFCVAVESNFFAKSCPNQWISYVNTINEAYDAAKSTAVSLGFDIIIFPSFSVSPLYNDTLTGFDFSHYNLIKLLKRDRFALSAYPDFSTIDEIPFDYFTRAKIIANESSPIIIAETGTNSEPFVIGTGNGPCLKV
jgi:hypothetical protein